MATVIITARKATGGGRATAPMLAVAGTARATEVISTTASNVVSTVIGAAGEVLMISVTGGAVKIADAVGANPNAATTPCDLLPDGGRIELYCDSNDTRIAVADA
jgi:hypothetical protein